jgi:hypothetical protein
LGTKTLGARERPANNISVKAFAAALAALVFVSRAACAVQLDAASAFETHYVSAVQRSLAADPFFGSKLVQSFDLHIAAVAGMPDAKAAGQYLSGQISGTGSVPLARVATGLRTDVLTESQAGAVLVAGALAAPHQFNAVASRLEVLKPGLGQKLVDSFHAAADGAAPRTSGALQKAGQVLRIQPTGLTYNSKGQWDTFFDAAIP